MDAVTFDEQLRSTPTVTRDPRDIMSIEEPPLHWVPYVHFGI